MTTMPAVWPVVLGYALGSIPFAWLLVRWASGRDLRQIGSGNLGATNALRAARWPVGVAVAVLDVAKGSAAVGLVALGGGDGQAQAIAAVGAVVGHMFPIWLTFAGGKGVATACGAFALVAPLETAAAAGVFAAMVVTTRLVSAASLVGVVVLAVACWAFGAAPAAGAAALLVAALIGWAHRDNIARLRTGTERRLW